jgi:hypothetical protein
VQVCHSFLHPVIGITIFVLAFFSDNFKRNFFNRKKVIVLSVLMAFTTCQKESINRNNKNVAKDAGREKLMADLMENPKPA